MRASSFTEPRSILNVDDYRRAFEIISDCHDAATLSEFREALIDSLNRNLAVADVSFFSGATLNMVFEDTSPLTEGATERMFPEYQDRWAHHDVFGSPPAVRQLLGSSVASLSELVSQHQLTASSEAYVRHFLFDRWRMRSAAAMRLPLSGGRTALIGLFGREANDLGLHDVGVLRLVGRHLAPVTKHLPVRQSAQEIGKLTERQRDVVRLVSEGLTNAQIATILNLAEDSVKKYVTRILNQTGCRTRLELALTARDARI